MTKPTSKSKTSSKSSHKQNFYLGLLAGAVIGAGVAYVSKHKKGDDIKKEILKKAKHYSKNLPNIIDELTGQPEEPEPQGIKGEILKLKKIITNNPDKKIKPPTPRTKVTKAVKKTATKTKRFFSKAGKILKK